MAKQIVRRPVGMEFDSPLVEGQALAQLLTDRANGRDSKLVSILTTNTPDTYRVVFAITKFVEQEIEVPDEVITDPEAIPQADGNSNTVQ